MFFIPAENRPAKNQTNENEEVVNENKVIDKDQFANKVLKYLWSDAFKRNGKDEIFTCKSLSELISTFTTDSKPFEKCFRDEFVKDLTDANKNVEDEADEKSKPNSNSDESTSSDNTDPATSTEN